MTDSNLVDTVDNQVLKVVLMTMHVCGNSVILHQGHQAALQAQVFGLGNILLGVGVH